MAYEYLRAQHRDGRAAKTRAAQERAASNLPVLDKWVRRAEQGYARSAHAPARFRAPPTPQARGLFPDSPLRVSSKVREREKIRTAQYLFYLVTDPSCDSERSGLYTAMIFDTPGARALFARFRAEQTRIIRDRLLHGVVEKPTPARPHRTLHATIGERMRARIG